MISKKNKSDKPAFHRLPRINAIAAASAQKTARIYPPARLTLATEVSDRYEKLTIPAKTSSGAAIRKAKSSINRSERP